eukprot:2735660-Prymnesium_polylepis.1
MPSPSSPATVFPPTSTASPTAIPAATARRMCGSASAATRGSACSSCSSCSIAAAAGCPSGSVAGADAAACPAAAAAAALPPQRSRTLRARLRDARAR